MDTTISMGVGRGSINVWLLTNLIGLDSVASPLTNSHIVTCLPLLKYLCLLTADFCTVLIPGTDPIKILQHKFYATLIFQAF